MDLLFCLRETVPALRQLIMFSRTSFQRVLGRNNSAPADTPTPIRIRTNTAQQIHQWWIRIMLKVGRCIRFAEIREHTIRILGADIENLSIDNNRGQKIFRNLFQEVREASGRETSTASTAYHRVIGNELVGEPLPRGSGVATQSAETCHHPETEMSRRGTAKMHTTNPATNPPTKIMIMWWTCRLCQSRWARHPIPDYGTSEAQDNDVMCFGKHAGKTYVEVLLTCPTYCDWVLMTAESGESPSPQLMRFAAYIQRQRQPQQARVNQQPATAMDFEEGYAEEWEDMPQEAEAAPKPKAKAARSRSKSQSSDPDL